MKIESCMNFAEFVQIFSQFGNEMVQLAHSSGDRQNVIFFFGSCYSQLFSLEGLFHCSLKINPSEFFLTGLEERTFSSSDGRCPVDTREIHNASPYNC